jgi:hypothetical protein
MGNMPGEGDDWVSQADLESLRMGRQYLVGLSGSGPSQAQAILDEASPAAAMQVVKLALHGDSESVRLQASRYILDRTVAQDGGGANDPWKEMQENVIKDIDKYLAENVGKNGPAKE